MKSGVKLLLLLAGLAFFTGCNKIGDGLARINSDAADHLQEDVRSRQ
jgi:hypothetical protein